MSDWTINDYQDTAAVAAIVLSGSGNGFSGSGVSAIPAGDGILQETGTDFILQETGDFILQEG